MSGCDSTQLTTDGVQYWSYGLSDPRPSELQRPQPRRPQIRWSPDSKKLVVYRTTSATSAQMPYISYTPQRPKVYTQPYALPGDTIVPVPGFHIIDVATKSNVAVNVPPRPSQLTITGFGARLGVERRLGQAVRHVDHARARRARTSRRWTPTPARIA